MSAIGKAVYVFSGEGQTVPLPLAESVVVLVVERNQGGWCRGFSAGKEGWFPASYVKEIPESTLTKVSLQMCIYLTPLEYSSLRYLMHYYSMQVCS